MNRIFAGLLVCLAFTVAVFAEVEELPDVAVVREPRPADSDVTKWVATILERYHYAKHGIDDDVSAELFAEFFEALDPNHYYFTAEDLAEFEPYRHVLDDMVKRGDVEFAFVVYERFIQRLRERLEYVRERVDDPFDFSTPEEITIKRQDADWPANRAEQDELWRKVVKNQILVAQLVDQFRAEQEAEDAAEEDGDADTEGKATADDPDAAPLSTERPPPERVVHFYEEYLRNVLENDGVDVMQAYLTTLSQLYDPHSAYMNWRSLEDFNISMKLSLKGIGALLSKEDGYTKVVDIIPGGPAERDGRLKPGDLIIAVAQGDGEPEDVVNMPQDKVVRKIRGPVDTKVRLTVTRGRQGVPREIDLIRDEVKLTEQEARAKVFEVDREADKLNLGVVDLPSFYADFEAMNAGKPDAKSTSRDVRRLIERMLEHHGVGGLVIDLRGNGGGALEEAIDLAGLFIPQGPVVQVKSGRGIEVREDDDGGFAFDLPLVVMTDRGTASASEIFAGAMQDYRRGIIVGDAGTHGKGTVQTVKHLADIPPLRETKPGALKFTMAKFYRVTGHSTQLLGVQPDIELPSVYDFLELGEKYQDHALPWDEIEPRDISVNRAVSDALPVLRERSAERLAVDEKYKRLIEDVQRYGKRRLDPTLSLNREDRIARHREDEYWNERSREIYNRDLFEEDPDADQTAEDEQAAKEEREASKASAEGPLPVKQAGKVTDVYLREALHILADLVEITGQGQIAERRETKAAQ